MSRLKPLDMAFLLLENGSRQMHISAYQMFKVHHALIDGGGALKLFRAAMSDKASDKTLRAVWAPLDKRHTRKKRAAAQAILEFEL